MNNRARHLCLLVLILFAVLQLSSCALTPDSFHSVVIAPKGTVTIGQGDSSMRIGAEWNFWEQYSLRAGWRTGGSDPADIDQGFSAGAGLHLGPLQLDYAYVPYGDFSSIAMSVKPTA